MAFDFVTSRQNKPHVTAEQAGALNLSIFGKGRFITEYADGLKLSLVNSNRVSIAPGALMVDGRFIVNERTEYVSIANGAQGKWRKDLIILTLKVDQSTGIGSLSLSSIQGKPADSEDAAKDPTFTAGDLSKGEYQAQVAIARVTLDGLKPNVELALPKVYSLDGHDFDILSCYKPADSDGSKVFWRAFGNKQMVTVQAQIFMNNTGAWTTAACPFKIPEGYRFTDCTNRIKEMGGNTGIDSLNGNILSVQMAMRDSDDANVHLMVKSDGSICVQNMGGVGHSSNWRWGTISYAVQR